MKDINLNLVVALARTHNDVFEKLEKNIQSFGLNTSEFGVLEMLYHKGEQPVQKVAEKILVTSGTITYVINKLEKKELVVRKKCEKDKRIFYINLTEKGEKLISEIFDDHKQFIDELFNGLDNKYKKELLKNLLKLRRNVK